MGGRRLAGGGRPGVSGKGSLGTSAPLFHIASKRAPQGPGSRHGSGRGRRTSNTRTRAGEVVLPGGRVHTGCLLPTPRSPPRHKRLRACPVLEFGLERCPRLWCGCWSWFPGAPRWSFWLAGRVGGRTAGLPGWGPDCPFRRGRRPRRLPPSTPSPADGPWCGLSWTTEVPGTVRGRFGGLLRVPGLRCPLGPDILTNAFPGAGPLDLPVSGPSGTRSSWTRPVSLWTGGRCGRETRLVR
jgi:hypothetical protein